MTEALRALTEAAQSSGLARSSSGAGSLRKLPHGIMYELRDDRFLSTRWLIRGGHQASGRSVESTNRRRGGPREGFDGGARCAPCRRLRSPDESHPSASARARERVDVEDSLVEVAHATRDSRANRSSSVTLCGARSAASAPGMAAADGAWTSELVRLGSHVETGAHVGALHVATEHPPHSAERSPSISRMRVPPAAPRARGEQRGPKPESRYGF